ncbi:MAG: T9SS type A sorting domain-containing protein [Bacteroidota bacterium]
MKNQLLPVLVLLCLISTAPLVGQNLSSEIRVFPGPFEYSLGSPDYREGTQIIPVGIDLYEGDEVNTIYYGRTPSNSSDKPVILFVHGYASNARVFFTGEDNMYADVYRDGYRSAYVSLTPNDDMWTNGFMLANMITRIKSHYNNAPLVVVGWSKGGVDIDAALVHFGANNQITEAFTLSTPHRGTGIAELANSQLLSLVNIIFMQNNDATLSLQRGYMNYFRSITDNKSSNNVPYTTIGGWGNGPLNRLDIPQGILHLIDGPKSAGGNDGVVPYQSSIRPGATELFGGLEKKFGFFGPYYDGPDQTNLDHFEVTRGGKVWPFIRNSLEQSSNGRQRFIQEYLPKEGQTIVSRMQWADVSKDESLIVSTHSQNSRLLTLSEEKAPIAMINEHNQRTIFETNISARSNTNANTIDLAGISPGRYRIESKEPIVFMSEEGGAEMILDIKQNVLRLDHSGLLNMVLRFNALSENEEVDIDAYLVPSVDLDMNRLEYKKIPLLLEQHKEGFNFYVNSSLGKGIYQLIIRAQGSNFKRDLMTSIAVTGIPQEDNNLGLNNWSVYPNPAQDIVNIRLEDTANESELTIYSMRGQVIYQTVIKAGTNSFQWPISSQHSGLYIVELKQKDKSTRQKLMIDN